MKKTNLSRKEAPELSLLSFSLSKLFAASLVAGPVAAKNHREADSVNKNKKTKLQFLCSTLFAKPVFNPEKYL